MDFLITGANGQLGKELQDILKLGNRSFVALGKDELDITDIVDVEEALVKYEPKVVINASAYTAVDKAENEKDICYDINVNGPKNLAKISKEIGAKLVQISTDYVFDGALNRLLKEDDETNPLNVYGETKLIGENQVTNLMDDNYLILRTSSVHGQYGANFVKTMIKLFDERGEVKVVDDQIMSPTYAKYLAEVILELVDKGVDKQIVNVSNLGAISWYEFSLQIREFLAQTDDKYNKVIINPCSSDEFPRPAKRPKYSAFNLDKLKFLLGHDIMSWQEGLKCHLKDLGYML